MIQSIFIDEKGKFSYDKNQLNNFNILYENKVASTKDVTLYYNNTCQIDCTIYFCESQNDKNIFLKDFNGPILLFKQNGFNINDLNYIEKRCIIANGKNKCRTYT